VGQPIIFNAQATKKATPKPKYFRKQPIPFREHPIKLADEIRKIAREGIQVNLPAVMGEVFLNPIKSNEDKQRPCPS